jgi:hypothetical protein
MMDVLPEPKLEAPLLYGQRPPRDSLLPWSWAVKRLEAAMEYWVVTVRPDGRPHARPVWGIWLPQGFWFFTGGLARENLQSNPHISVHLESGKEVLVMEGESNREADPDVLASICATYSAKYSYKVQPVGDQVADEEGNRGPAFRVVPRVAFGWEDDMSYPTRWRFSLRP